MIIRSLWSGPWLRGSPTVNLLSHCQRDCCSNRKCCSFGPLYDPEMQHSVPSLWRLLLLFVRPLYLLGMFVLLVCLYCMFYLSVLVVCLFRLSALQVPSCLPLRVLYAGFVGWLCFYGCFVCLTQVLRWLALLEDPLVPREPTRKQRQGV